MAPTCPACGSDLGPINAVVVSCPTCRYIVDVEARFPAMAVPAAPVPDQDKAKESPPTTHKPAQPQPKRKGGR